MTLLESTEIADQVKEHSLKGVSLWSINRDTNRRSHEVKPICNELQTGLQDGTFHKTIQNIILSN